MCLINLLSTLLPQLHIHPGVDCFIGIHYFEAQDIDCFSRIVNYFKNPLFTCSTDLVIPMLTCGTLSELSLLANIKTKQFDKRKIRSHDLLHVFKVNNQPFLVYLTTHNRPVCFVTSYSCVSMTIN